MSVSIAVYGMSSQVQWLLQLHCADKVARCIVLDTFERYSHPGWCTYTNIWIQNSQKFVFKTPVCLVFGFILCLFLSPFWGKRGKGVICSQNPCVFFSSVYVVLNVVFILGVFVPVKSINASGMSITLLFEQNVYRYYALTDHTLSLLFTRYQVCFHFMSPFFNGPSPAFVLLL